MRKRIKTTLLAFLVMLMTALAFSARADQNILLPNPIYFENFDALTERGLPVGWTVTNNTDTVTPGENIGDLKSDTYKNWVVVSADRLRGLKSGIFDQPAITLNGVKIGRLGSGNMLYAESDARGGNQVQYAFTGDYDLTGKSNVYVAFNSLYEQNQDNINSLEYSIDKGASWLPALYLIDQFNDAAVDNLPFSQGDIYFDAFGNIDAVKTLNTVHAEDAAFGKSYGAYIAAPITQDLAPYISGRANDDQFESKRIEILRLLKADNQATVRFRFMQAGTGSWYWGIDDFGIYSFPQPTISFTAQPRDITVTEGQTAKFQVRATNPTFSVAYQWQRNGKDIEGAVFRDYSVQAALPADHEAKFRCLVRIPGYSVFSEEATLRVEGDHIPPALVSAEGSIGLTQVTLTFTEPVNSTDASDTNHFKMNGGVTVLATKPGGNPASIVLTTTLQTEGAEYTLTVNGIHDESAAANPIAPGSEIHFFAWENEEFVGPFPSWANVTNVEFGAKGNGMADDTDALQRALDSIGSNGEPSGENRRAVLWLPSGTYRITRTLRMVSRLSVSVFGEHPDTTCIKWDGSDGGIMFEADAVAYARFGRITWDGSGRANVAMLHTQRKKDDNHVTNVEHVDERYVDLAFGLRVNPENGGDTITLRRCQFIRCSDAGVNFESANALDWHFWHCLFQDCRVGIRCGNGSFHVYDSLFLRSTEADLAPSSGGYYGIRRNVSIGSQAFFQVGFSEYSTHLTLVGNRIIDPVTNTPVRLGTRGPLVMLDNTFRSRSSQAEGPVMRVSDNLFAVGNIFTVPNPIVCEGRTHVLDNRIVSQSDISGEPPALPGVAIRKAQPLFEVSAGAPSEAIQAAISQADALRGQRPIVHLPRGDYPLTNTLTIPAGSDLQLVGDGPGNSSTLRWSGDSVGPVLRLAGPSHARVRGIAVNGRSVPGIVVDNADQPGARVYLDQINLGVTSEPPLRVDRLRHTWVRGETVVHGPNLGTGFEVIGVGDLSVEGRVSIYGGAAGGGVADGVIYRIRNGGRLMVQDLWYEGATHRYFRADELSEFVLNGAGMATDDPDHGGIAGDTPSIDFSDAGGNFTFVNTRLPITNTFARIAPEAGPDANLLFVGNDGPPGYWRNESKDAGIHLHLPLEFRTAGERNLPGSDNVDTTEVRRLLARLRFDNPGPIARQPTGVTDVRLDQVQVQFASVGLLVTGINQPPTMDKVNDQTVAEESTLSFSLANAASDPDQPYQKLSFSFGAGSPEGASLTPDGLFTWKPTEAQGPSTNQVIVIVRDDGSPTLRATNSFTIVVNEANLPPALLPVPDQQAWQRIPFSYQVEVEDPDTLGFEETPVAGGLRMEIWKDLSGDDLGALTDARRNPKWPDRPDTTAIVTNFESPSGIMDHYGVRLSGYLIPPETGDYTFYLASDNQGELWLSSDSSPAHKHKIAFEPEWNSSRDWTGVARRPNRENISGPVPLKANVPYYVEALMEEGTGGDNLGVAWKTPAQAGPPLNGSAPIPGNFLGLRNVKKNHFTFALTEAPAGASIDPGSGQFNWTPGIAQPTGAYRVVVRVTDDGYPALSATNSFTIVVNSDLPEILGVTVEKPSADSARFTAQVKPNRSQTGAWFEWGLSTAYGNSSALENLGNGTGTVTFVTSIGSLIPGQTYHLRVVATNSFGKTLGSDTTFATREAVTSFGLAARSLFDQLFYLTYNPSVAVAVQAGTWASVFDHFYYVGQLLPLRPNSVYDEAFYLAANPDIAAAVTAHIFHSGFEHFAAYGQREGRVFSPFFDARAYLRLNPDVAAAVTAGTLVSGFQHFIESGQFENRPIAALYDEEWYLTRNPDVAAAVAARAWSSGFEHFIAFGYGERRNYSPFYDEAAYLSFNPDVAAAAGFGKPWRAGLNHFVRYGQFEGRQHLYPPLLVVADDSGAGTDRSASFPDTELGGDSSVIAFYLSNTGEQALHLTNLGLQGANTNDFTFVVFNDKGTLSSPADLLITGGKTWRVEARFHPKHLGKRSAALAFQSNESSGGGQLNLTGAGTTAWYDEAFYLTRNPDVSAALPLGIFPSGYAHFINYGFKEGREFTPYFDEDVYLSVYPDAAALVGVSRTYASGFEHFIMQGVSEGKLFYAVYDESFYLTRNPDVASAVTAHVWGSGLPHFLLYGRLEGRDYSPYFSDRTYLATYPTVVSQIGPGKVYPSALYYHIFKGQFEGR